MPVLAAFVLLGLQTKPAPIDAYARSIDKMPLKHRYFGDAAGENGPPMWAEFPTMKDLNGAAEGGKVYTACVTGWSRGKLLLATFTFSSPSGDWARFVNYYYRPDGTLAKRDGSFSFLPGNYIIREVDRYAIRKLLSRTFEYRDLNTNKPLRHHVQSPMPDAPVYRTTASLPFFGLLR